jgi:hypothetical protein
MKQVSSLARGLAVLLCVLLGALPVRAQGTTSRVVGVVTDTSGGVIPGANVTLVNEATGVTFTTVTTDAGTYTFEAIGSGTYTVKIELQGFKTFSSPGNIVAIGQSTTVNATLETGALAETVEVVSAAPTVQVSDSGNLGTVIDQKSVQALPIVGGRGRNPLDLVLTQPGVVSGANTGGGTHVHGARDRAWNYTLDGIDTNESSAGGSNFSPLRTNPDALQEFKVLTGNFSAEFGRNSGGQVAMVSRSGSNDLHGTGFYFARRPQFNANEWENNAILPPIGKRQEDLNIAGFSLGGPIRRNKTFFFANVQVLRGDREITVTRRVYTESARQGTWRYVPGGRNQPFGVTGASVDASGNPVVGVASYNIPGNDPQRIGLSRTTQDIVSKTPLPNDFTVGDGLNIAGYTFKPVEEEKQHDVLLRVDQALSTRHYVFGRVAWGEQNTLCDNVNLGLQTYPGLSCTVDTERSPFNIAGSWRWNPGSSIVNELVVGGNHFTFNFVTPEATPGATAYVFSDQASGTQDVTMPQEFQWGNLRTINTYQVVNNTTYVRGAHTFKGGVNIRYQQHEDERGSVGGANVNPIVRFTSGSGAPSFATVDPTTFQLPSNMQLANDRPALQRAINFLLGRVDSISQGFVQQGDGYAPGGTTFIFDSRYPEVDFYLQDNWKLRPNITVDAGLRWELKMTPGNPEGLIRRPDQSLAVNQPSSNTLTWLPGDLYEDDVNNLAPSVGVAWDPANDGKSVVRANYRIAYDRINTFAFSSAIFQSIPGITNTVTNTEFGQGGGRVDNLPSLAPSQRPEDAIRPTATGSSSITVVDPAFQAPLTHGWSVGYQRELWSRAVLEVVYVGRKAENLFGAYNVNQALIRENGFLDAFNVVKGGGQSALINQLLSVDSRRQASETGSDFMRRQYATQLTLNSVANVAQDIGRRVQGGRSIAELSGLGPYFFFPYPQFLGGVNVIDSGDHSDYHALEVTLQRRFGGGFGYLLGYTLARSRDTRSFDPAFTVVGTGSGQSASSTPFDIYDRELNFAPSDFDRRHSLQASFVTELPFGRGKRWGSDMHPAVDAFVGGWEVAGIVRATSGRPFTVYGGSFTLSNVVQTPANCSGCSGSEGEVFDDEATGVKYFFDGSERALFSTPGAGEFSNVGRNAFVGPKLFNMDLSATKRFRLFGTHTFEYRVDVTNLTNTPNFGFPTAISTDPTFGRIARSVLSFSRKIQMGVKYTF